MMVMIMVPFMFVGLDVISQAAEEINLPFRAIGRVLMLSVLMAVFWYALILYGTSMMLAPAALDQASLLPVRMRPCSEILINDGGGAFL